MANARDVLEVRGMPQLHQMARSVTGFNNSGISIHYVSEWALKEALRELIQNAIDGMVSFMKIRDANSHKSDWKVNMHEHTHTDGVYRTFTFTWPTQQDIVIGKITYDPDTQQLTLENPGAINKFNLLLGGSGASKQQNDPDIIGRFGEGMKLAALALLRPAQKPYAQHLATHTRRLTIDTGGQRWLFKLQPDNNFDDEICLFYKIRHLTAREARHTQEGWTYTRIQGVTFDEWANSYKNFILFCKPEEKMEIATIGNPTHKGSLLLEDSMKGRFFVKDLHIHDYGSYEYDAKDDPRTIDNFSKGGPAASYYGYNTNEVELNRDRKGIPNLWHKYARSSCIVANVMNNVQTNLNQYPDAMDYLNEMPTIIYWSLRLGRWEVYYLSQHASVATCDRIWNEWKKDKTYFANNENVNNKVMPMYTSHQVSCIAFMRQHQLESSFYEYKVLSNVLCAVLYKSTRYESWNTRFNALINGCTDSQLNGEEITIKERLLERLARVRDGFNSNMICFKDAPLRAQTSFCRNNVLYLAKGLLQNETTLFLKCLSLLNISSERLLEFCNL